MSSSMMLNDGGMRWDRRETLKSRVELANDCHGADGRFCETHGDYHGEPTWKTLHNASEYGAYGSPAQKVSQAKWNQRRNAALEAVSGIKDHGERATARLDLFLQSVGADGLKGKSAADFNKGLDALGDHLRSGEPESADAPFPPSEIASAPLDDQIDYKLVNMLEGSINDYHTTYMPAKEAEHRVMARDVDGRDIALRVLMGDYKATETDNESIPSEAILPKRVEKPGAKEIYPPGWSKYNPKTDQYDPPEVWRKGK